MKKRSILAISIALLLALATVGLSACKGASFDANKNISVVAREDGSGTKSAFMEIVGLKGKSDIKGIIIGTGTAGVLAEVKGNPQAIAYESLGYVTADVKKLTVEGKEANTANIKDGSYKIARPLNILFKQETLNNTLNKAFYDFLASKTAQDIISENGYVSTKDNAPTYNLQAGLKGTIDISGSTSLQPLMIVLAQKFEDIQSGVSITVSGGGSGTGYKNANDGVSDFGMISEEFNQSKAPNCSSQEVAKDGIAIIVNKKNPITNITLADIKAIYNAEQPADSKIVTWSQIGNK
ncbi:MAG: substrate-binding domain-containing protein [Clostridia bacterium]